MPNDSLEELYTKVAKKILNETLHVKKGDAITVEAWNNGIPFARRVMAEARALGCTAIMVLEDEEAYVEGVRRAPRESVGMMGKNEYGLLAGSDAYIFIPGQALGVYSKTLKPEERDHSTRYNSSWYEAADKAGLRGARLTFGYVGKDLAKLVGKKIEDIVRAQLRASLVDLKGISNATSGVARILTDGAAAELQSGHSTLKFKLKGELTIDDGVVDINDLKTGNNMAYALPGLVTKEVDPGSARGKVTITDTLTKYGVIHRAELEFKGGRLVSWASREASTIKKLVEEVPAERRTLKILGIGFNPAFGFGNGQDRFVYGAVTLGGFGFTTLVKKGTLSVESTKVVDGGSLTHSA